jgi:MFS family permease
MARAARDWFPFAERGRAQGFVWTFGRLGGAVAPLLIMGLAYPVAAAGLPGWRGAFVLLGLVGVVWVAGFARSFHNTSDEHPDVNDAERRLIREGPVRVAPAPLSWATVLSSPTLWLLSGMYFCGNCGWSFFITYVTPYLQHDLGWHGWQLHAASGLPLLCGAVGCLLGGVVTDRQVRVWGRRWGRTFQGVVACAAAGGLFLLAMRLTKSNAGLAFGALCLAAFAKDFTMAASWATTIDIGHAYSGTVAGVMNSVGNLGTVVSAPLVAWLASVAGSTAGPDWRTSLYFYASMFFAAAVCWLFINPRRVIVYANADRTSGGGGGCLIG